MGSAASLAQRPPASGCFAPVGFYQQLQSAAARNLSPAAGPAARARASPRPPSAQGARAGAARRGSAARARPARPGPRAAFGRLSSARVPSVLHSLLPPWTCRCPRPFATGARHFPPAPIVQTQRHAPRLGLPTPRLAHLNTPLMSPGLARLSREVLSWWCCSTPVNAAIGKKKCSMPPSASRR